MFTFRVNGRNNKTGQKPESLSDGPHLLSCRFMYSLPQKPIISHLYRHRYTFFLGLLAIISVINMQIDIMEVDAAQYASISLEMSETGNYLEIYHRGDDYLDKPPLLFWLSSLSISVFGNTNPGYKLPAVILLWLGLWALYGFTKLWYDHQRAVISTLIFGSSQAFFLMTNDIRTDGILTAFVLLSLYSISLYLKKDRAVWLLPAGLCIGAAMLAKGPLGLIIPAVATGGHLLLRGKWKKIFDLRWLLMLLPLCLVLAPMLYGLYIQFDLHPEKEVYGLKGPSGIWFYFWTQSFGRITGENYWQNDTSIFYFLKTILWDFQPWVLIFLPAIIEKIKSIFRAKENTSGMPEWITLCGFIIPFIALSFSRYKLPHYIFPLLPFAAVITSDWIVSRAKKMPKWMEILHFSIIHILVLLAALIILWVFPVGNFWIAGFCIGMYIMFWIFNRVSDDPAEKWIFPTVCIGLIFQFVLCFHFYPQLLRYQSTSQAGKLIEAEEPGSVYWYKKHGHALDYYSGRIIPELEGPDPGQLSKGTWIYTNEDGLRDLPEHILVKDYSDYPVTLLKLPFLDPQKRQETLGKAFLVEIK